MTTRCCLRGHVLDDHGQQLLADHRAGLLEVVHELAQALDRLLHLVLSCSPERAVPSRPWKAGLTDCNCTAWRASTSILYCCSFSWKSRVTSKRARLWPSRWR